MDRSACISTRSAPRHSGRALGRLHTKQNNIRNMKIVFYILTFLFGLYGVAAVLRAIELLATSGGFQPATVLFGIVGLVLAFACLKKARAKAAQPK